MGPFSGLSPPQVAKIRALIRAHRHSVPFSDGKWRGTRCVCGHSKRGGLAKIWPDARNKIQSGRLDPPSTVSFDSQLSLPCLVSNRIRFQVHVRLIAGHPMKMILLFLLGVEYLDLFTSSA